ncbi:MAG: YcxB family protein [Lachnospiraceae bacterium]|nr:YcxB family protein [Lachnospiraceae bacterium]
MELEFDVKIDAKVLYDYMLHHTYTGFQGVLGTAVGALMLVGFAATNYIIWLIGGIVLLAYLPWSLFLRSRQQMLNTPAFRQPLHYRITDEGVEISQGEIKEFQKWENMVKATSTGKSIILYTSAVNASIFPRADLGEKQVFLIEMISRNMSAKKVKIKS